MKPNAANIEELAKRLLDSVCLVQKELGWNGPAAASITDRFADLLDSMGMVEFVLKVAEDHGTMPDDIEACVERQFGTIMELARGMCAAGLSADEESPVEVSSGPTSIAPRSDSGCWIAAPAVKLPACLQMAEEIDALIGRPGGWLRKHAGIEARRLWQGEDPLAAAVEAARDCLAKARLKPTDVHALLVTSEAPPQLLGLAAGLQHRLGLPAGTPALEVGGACTGFLAALWLGRSIVSRVGPVLVLAVEAPSQLLRIEPGPSGEAAALFGDGAAACILCDRPVVSEAVPLLDVAVGADGSGENLLRVERTTTGLDLRMRGPALAERAIRVMADKGRALVQQHRLEFAQIEAVVPHGGNGRMPALLARKLDIAVEKTWSETARLGNLGSATLPVAWAARGPCTGPALWIAIGAGLTWATALTGVGPAA